MAKPKNVIGQTSLEKLPSTSMKQYGFVKMQTDIKSAAINRWVPWGPLKSDESRAKLDWRQYERFAHHALCG
jgi:hypothetical protein